MLTPYQVEAIRDEIGTAEPPTVADLDALYSRLGTLGAVIYTVLSRRLADLRAAPSTFAIPGEYSQSTAANVAALERQVARWARFAPDAQGGDTFGTLQLRSRHSR